MMPAAAPGMLAVAAVAERLQRHLGQQRSSQASVGVKLASCLLQAECIQCACDASCMRLQCCANPEAGCTALEMRHLSSHPCLALHLTCLTAWRLKFSAGLFKKNHSAA